MGAPPIRQYVPGVTCCVERSIWSGSLPATCNAAAPLVTTPQSAWVRQPPTICKSFKASAYKEMMSVWVAGRQNHHCELTEPYILSAVTFWLAHTTSCPPILLGVLFKFCMVIVTPTRSRLLFPRVTHLSLNQLGRVLSQPLHDFCLLNDYMILFVEVLCEWTMLKPLHCS